MTHVFIVNDTTLKYHLEYMFAGTGANTDAPFLYDENYQNPRKKENGLTSASERNIVAMIADISRVKEGDKIIFYLQAGGHEGKFYGVFKATGMPFYDSNDHNYLASEMWKTLNFRVKIEADEVYPLGISEHEALDLLDGVEHPSQMCWSLIYRKLKGNRGCTMITDYESDRLIHKIRRMNGNQALQERAFSFDAETGKMIGIDEVKSYIGAMDSVDISKRLLVKYKSRKAFESHLQAYIVQNCLKQPLSDILGIDRENPVWVGNEVSCGVGMQRIDVVISQETENAAVINLVELKDECPYDGIVTYQLPWYVTWIMNYWAPLYRHKKLTIIPVVIAKKDLPENEAHFKALASGWTYGNLPDGIEVTPVHYIAFSVDDDISFERIF